MNGRRPRSSAVRYSPKQHRAADRILRLFALRQEVPLLRRSFAGARNGILSACAALVAYLPAQALGLHQSFWSAITAVAVVQTEFSAAESTARDQFLGAAIGGITGVGASLLFGQDLLAYALAVIAAVVACWILNLVSASRLAAVTTTIILLVPHTGSAERMFVSRLCEVGWGVCSAIGAVWLAAHFTGGSLLRLTRNRSERRRPG